MFFLDATYKTTVYDAPLFFLAIKTNVDYKVVGAFLAEDETTVTIAEALTILKKECYLSSPQYFLTDFDESEINAVEKVFSGYMHDFYKVNWIYSKDTWRADRRQSEEDKS